MTIERLTLLIALAALALAPGCTGHEARRGDRVDVSGFPLEIQDAYRVFAFRCSRCHTLARPLNARIDDPEHWVRYVRRMRRQSGSGIDAQNSEVILKFLLYYHRERMQGGGDSAGSETEREPSPAPPEPIPAPSVQPAPVPEAPPADPQPAPAPAAPNAPESAPTEIVP